jgi:phage virion morphogenesis protein
MADDLDLLAPWLAGFTARLEPGRRLRLARRIGVLLRQVNAQRVLANVEPDGSPMAARKPRPARAAARKRGRIRKTKAAMFRRIELARNMVVRPSAEGVALGFKGRVANTAAVHHFGLEDAVDRRIRNSIRVRYPARRLLGFAEADEAAIMADALAWLQGLG